MRRPFLETYETDKPWIVWQYVRSDFWGMILGGLILGECLICGAIEELKLGRRGIWFPPKDKNYRHPKRDEFINKHIHTEAEQQNRLMWSRPLRNII